MFDVLGSLLRGEEPASAQSLPADLLLPDHHPPERETPIHPRLVPPEQASPQREKTHSTTNIGYTAFYDGNY